MKVKRVRFFEFDEKPDFAESAPNMMFEQGVRMAHEKPVALMKAEGSGAFFDIDTMLRVFEYSPNLWQLTIERDMPNLRDFIKGAWDNHDPQKAHIKFCEQESRP